jgi:uroporphyrinogen decarboxylase
MTSSIETQSATKSSVAESPNAELTKLDRFNRAIRGEQVDRPPVWIMRQAGRYMPEYRAIRERASFDDLCTNADLATEVTLLPLTLLDIDALIVFNDILVPLNHMGCEVVFQAGGPVIQKPVRSSDQLDGHFRAVDYMDADDEPAVCKSLTQIRREAGDDIPVLGFAGAPFTMAAYAIEGKMSRNLDRIKSMYYQDPKLLHAILERLAETIANYLIAQVKLGGATAVQLFDTWAGMLAPSSFDDVALRYQTAAIERVRAACSDTPIFLFLRGSGENTIKAASAGADVLSIDWRQSLAAVRKAIWEKSGDSLKIPVLQGNLEPLALMGSHERIAKEFHQSIEGFDPYNGYIANLGHGILPPTPVDSARAFVDIVKGLKK